MGLLEALLYLRDAVILIFDFLVTFVATITRR